MRNHIFCLVAISMGFVGAGATIGGDGKKTEDVLAGWTWDFSAEKPHLVYTGRNPYFILEPGYLLVLEGGNERMTITVKDQTKMVDGVLCRVVEEKETKDGKVVELSRNYFAISKRTNSVYYFGEDKGGAWLSGEKGAKFGLMMPGLPLVGAKHYQEIALKVALDRSEILSVSETVKTPAGVFKNCLKVRETTPLEPTETKYKYYAPGVGMVQEGALKLVKYGNVAKAKD